MSQRPQAKKKRHSAAKMKRVTVASLTWGERLDIITALSQVLEGVYSHLPLKRSLYGLDVVRGLENLRQQVPTMTDIGFHRELTLLMNRLRDAHTQYRGPWTVTDAVASLPFLVEAFGPVERPTFVVSKIDRRSIADLRFRPGVTIEYWNGVPFDRAVELHADHVTGGRPDARRARALESLTFRSLEYAPPPDEDWVVLGYRDLRGKAREVRLSWEGINPERAQAASCGMATRVRRGIDPGGEAVRRGKKYRFNPKLWRADRSVKVARGIRDQFADFLSSRRVKTKSGVFGYLRVWSFDVNDDDEFLKAAIAHLKALPDRGLIIDLRANPGGFIWAAERMLQLFTPKRISPTTFALRATPITAALARAAFNRDELQPWEDSLTNAELTGEPYSSHLPITPPELCNDIGQRYGGPVVVVVDANTYSSGDLFTAGVVDNRIGPVVCIGEATGAGGANVWESEVIRAALSAAKIPLPPLPEGVSFTVAIRRAVRSNDAAGTLIEDAGIPGQPYAMTRNDIFRGNRDLLDYCGALLATQPHTRLNANWKGKELILDTMGLDEIELYLDGRPTGLPISLKRDGTRRIRGLTGSVEVVGFANGELLQRRRLNKQRHS
jgi:hypothetical protein